MVRYLYRAWNEAASRDIRYFAVQVESIEDRWSSTCLEVDEEGNEKAGAASVAPRFYGTNAEQAHRRMRDVLENTYDRVEPMTSRLGD